MGDFSAQGLRDREVYVAENAGGSVSAQEQAGRWERVNAVMGIDLS